jgi:hypothetical protein
VDDKIETSGEVGREWLVLVDGKIKTSGVKLDESCWFWGMRKSRLQDDVGRESLVFGTRKEELPPRLDERGWFRRTRKKKSLGHARRKTEDALCCLLAKGVRRR